MNKQEIQALISENIKANGKGEITAEVLAEVLNGMVDATPNVKVIELGEIDFRGYRRISLSSEQRNYVWNAMYGHDFPYMAEERKSDMEKNVLFMFAPFWAKNFGEQGYSSCMIGWVLEGHVDSNSEGWLYLIDPGNQNGGITIYED